MREAFPPSADLMLRDWERVLGLPEECIPYPTTFAGRQAAVALQLENGDGAVLLMRDRQLLFAFQQQDVPWRSAATGDVLEQSRDSGFIKREDRDAR